MIKFILNYFLLLTQFRNMQWCNSHDSSIRRLNLKNSSPSVGDGDRNENNYAHLSNDGKKRDGRRNKSVKTREWTGVDRYVFSFENTHRRGVVVLLAVWHENDLGISCAIYEDEISYRPRRVDVLARRTRRITWKKKGRREKWEGVNEGWEERELLSWVTRQWGHWDPMDPSWHSLRKLWHFSQGNLLFKL